MSRRRWKEDIERRLRNLELREYYPDPESLAREIAHAMTLVSRATDDTACDQLNHRDRAFLAELLRYGEERMWRGHLRPPEPPEEPF